MLEVKKKKKKELQHKATIKLVGCKTKEVVIVAAQMSEDIYPFLENLVSEIRIVVKVSIIHKTSKNTLLSIFLELY